MVADRCQYRLPVIRRIVLMGPARRLTPAQVAEFGRDWWSLGWCQKTEGPWTGSQAKLAILNLVVGTMVGVIGLSGQAQAGNHRPGAERLEADCRVAAPTRRRPR